MQDLVRYARSPGTLIASRFEGPDETICTCCQHARATVSVAGKALCPTCLPAYALDTPRIDETASLIWLPHVDQGVLSRLTLALHAVCAQQGEAIGTATTGPAGHAGAIFAELRAQAGGLIERIGTAQISHLREAARKLSQAPLQRQHVASGIRVLHHGVGLPDEPNSYRHYLNTLKEGSSS
ncbi:hypothetical protein [Asaia krungthepensis]|uniref:Uncharacterized protein n=1 Tax=Asaia krungthepensis NRIC 0535 TaxID=1307925 RepID=A0ABQ0Q4N1_9PROT|nr:hypothetical protein [Asaia krungthepensis]GBQ91228.1 hypothetical protein AA0535_2243 [Asaia krungthepensis NRIC 0535]